MNRFIKFIKTFSSNFLRTFVLFFVFGIVLALYQVVDRTLDDIWHEAEIPYPQVKSEYLSTLFLTDKRIRLRNMGYEDDNLIQKGLKSWQENIYQSAIKKLPEKSFMKTWFWTKHELAPYTMADKIKNPERYAGKAMDLMKKVFEEWNQDKTVKDSLKLMIYRNGSRLFTVNIEYFAPKVKEYFELINLSDSFNKNIIKAFGNCTKEQACYIYYNNLYENLYRKLYFLKPRINLKEKCKTETIKAFVKDLDSLAAFYNKYKKNMSTETSILFFNTVIESFKENYFLYKKLLKHECNIELTNLED